MKRFSKILAVLLGSAMVLLGAPAQADDSEVFTNSSAIATGIRPNVLFIIDTSGSMDTKVNVFSGTKTYTGDCPAGRVYWRTEDTKEPPDCKGNQWVSVDNNRCRAAFNGMNTSGWWRGYTAMLDKSGNPTFWGNLVAGKDNKLECQSDNGKHGDRPGSQSASENRYARNGSGTSDSNRWGDNNSGSLVNWSGRQRISLYTSDYANWYSSTESGDVKTRLEIVQEVATQMVADLDGVNLGLMRYSTNAEGGMVVYPVSELTTASRKAMTDAINGFTPNGYTPLSETMYEAYRYLANKRVLFGASSSPSLSVAESRVNGDINNTTYDGPMDFSCQTTYVVYLTDGLPTQDNSADTRIETLAGTPCPAEIDNPDPSFPTSGRCLESITNYMNKNDLRTDIVGDQKVISYFIGFGDDVASSKAYLEQVAKAGGGKAYTQTDAAGLSSTLEEIFSQVVTDADTTFVSPAVSVNAFNRSQNLNEIFVSVFAPSKTTHWAGNLKKYRIWKGDIYGSSSAAPAVDKATGFFAKGSQALNTEGGVLDGPDAEKGGAASSFPDPDSRNMYTYLGANKDLTASENAFKDGNAAITSAMVNAVDATERTRVINYARGLDYYDEDKDGSTSDTHNRMGDPMHARPAILVHGGTATNPDATVFVPTNDGMLHAFDMNSVGSGADPATANVGPTNERWSFIPQEFLARQGVMYDDAPAGNRSYALDGDVKIFKYDINQNGVIDAGDKAYLFFGTGRGGQSYYSLDVTDVTKPKFRWKISNTDADFSRFGYTWSAPQIARVQIGTGSGQNAQKFVLIFGGGYDTANDSEPSPFVASAQDSIGNQIYMVDLETGALLWKGGATGTGLTFVNAKMTHSFPADITVLDTNGDRFADRMYAADMAGQVWRFDIWNGNSSSQLVTGGVIASLGQKGVGTPTAADNRRFYYAPDVAPMTARGSHPFMNIALGSGYRGHPLSKAVQDRFYSLRDYNPYDKLTQAQYDALTPVKDADSNLVNITASVGTAVDDSKSGWKLTLNNPTWQGEKVLAESVTAAGVIFFPTFTPLQADPSNPCLSKPSNRVYAVLANNGDPFAHWIDGQTGALTTSDRFMDLAQKGIAPAVAILNNPGGAAGGGGSALCQVGAQILNRCVPVGDPVRSYWEHK